jgi:hypothetical protein
MRIEMIGMPVPCLPCRLPLPATRMSSTARPSLAGAGRRKVIVQQ